MIRAAIILPCMSQARQHETFTPETVDTKSAEKYFVIHVGPQKTASTFLQGAAAYFSENTFIDDNYNYTGKAATMGPMYDALKDLNCHEKVHKAREAGDPMPDCWGTGFVAALEEFGDSNILVSSEDLRIPVAVDTPGWWGALKESAADRGYNVVVVLAYRRLYAWLPSAYAQNNAGGIHNHRWIDWPGTNDRVKVV